MLTLLTKKYCNRTDFFFFFLQINTRFLEAYIPENGFSHKFGLICLEKFTSQIFSCNLLVRFPPFYRFAGLPLPLFFEGFPLPYTSPGHLSGKHPPRMSIPLSVLDTQLPPYATIKKLKKNKTVERWN